jgi:hypothetical protein
MTQALSVVMPTVLQYYEFKYTFNLLKLIWYIVIIKLSLISYNFYFNIFSIPNVFIRATSDLWPRNSNLKV